MRAAATAAGRKMFDNSLLTAKHPSDESEQKKKCVFLCVRAFCVCQRNPVRAIVCVPVHMPRVKLFVHICRRAQAAVTRTVYTSKRRYVFHIQCVDCFCSTPIISPLFERRQYLYSILCRSRTPFHEYSRSAALAHSTPTAHSTHTHTTY